MREPNPPIEYEIGEGRDRMHIRLEDPLSDEEMIKYKLDRQERVWARSLPGYAQEVRAKFEPPKPPPPPATVYSETALQAAVANAINLSQQQRGAEFSARIRPLLKGIGKSVRENIRDPFLKRFAEQDVRLTALENKTSSMADASVVGQDQARISELERKVESMTEQFKQIRSEKDRLAQQLSANQKHCQALEKKLGPLLPVSQWGGSTPHSK